MTISCVHNISELVGGFLSDMQAFETSLATEFGDTDLIFKVSIDIVKFVVEEQQFFIFFPSKKQVLQVLLHLH